MTASLAPTIALAILAAASASIAQEDQPTRALDPQTAKEKTLEALTASGFDIELFRDDFEALWLDQPSTLAAIAYTLSIFHEPARQAMLTSVPQRHQPWAEPQLLHDTQIDPFLRTNFALYLAQQLVNAEYLDEAMGLLAHCDAPEVADPATHRFLLAVAQYHLGRRSETLDAIANFQLVQDPPERYAATIQLLLVALQQSEPDSLDAIADEMRDIRRRLDLGRTNKQVQDVEESVLQKLNAMIEELEKQRQDQEQSADQLQPGTPAPDSQPLGGQGEGAVDPKRLADQKNWGNLPPKEREKAIQDIGRDLPGHYRDAVEQYFRRLAEIPVRKEP